VQYANEYPYASRENISAVSRREGGTELPNAQNLNPTESWFAHEQLSAEELCVKKCSLYLNQIQDPQLKGEVQQIMDTCQRHVTSMQQLTGQSSPGGKTMM